MNRMVAAWILFVVWAVGFATILVTAYRQPQPTTVTRVHDALITPTFTMCEEHVALLVPHTLRNETFECPRGHIDWFELTHGVLVMCVCQYHDSPPPPPWHHAGGE